MSIHRFRRLATLKAGGFVAIFALSAGLSLPAISAEPAIKQGEPAGKQMAAAGITRRLQMGVGKSVIVDLPGEAAEIFVGDPKVADAIVRSSRRLYIDALANGQTSIFALDKDGRQIAVFEVSIGRDVGELTDLLRVAIPGNDIQVRTVANSVILVGSVASAGEAQKAIDIAKGFVGNSVVTASSSPGGGGGGAPTAGGTSVNVSTPNRPVTGKVINSLTIRGLDQVALRVTVTEIRREILKQLGISYQGTGQNGSSLTISTIPSRSTARLRRAKR